VNRRARNRVVPHKILEKNSDPEYYNKAEKLLKVTVRKVYKKRKLGQRHQVELKRISKELLAAKICTRNIFAVSITK
jgi:hypothetical protein